MSFVGLLGAGSGSSTIRSPFVILSHSLVRLERMRSNLHPTGIEGPQTLAYLPTITQRGRMSHPISVVMKMQKGARGLSSLLSKEIQSGYFV